MNAQNRPGSQGKWKYERKAFDRLLDPTTNWMWPYQNEWYVSHSPNLTTITRIIGSIIVGLYLIAHPMIAAAALLTITLVFLIITDAYDGHLSRKLSRRSLAGALMDPLADKIFVIMLTFGLIERFHDPKFTEVALALIIIEVMTATLGTYTSWRASKMGHSDKVGAALVGKIKVCLEFVMLLTGWLLPPALGLLPARALCTLAIPFAIVSFATYARKLSLLNQAKPAPAEG